MSTAKKNITGPFRKGAIQGVHVRSLKKYQDSRGWLTEIFRSDELSSNLIPMMSYISEALPGATRGPHEHEDQTDHFCFLGPSTFRLVLWDNCLSSPAYWYRQELLVGEENPSAIIVPEGVVHTYRNVGNNPGWVINCPNRLYAGNGRKQPVDEIRHESDPDTLFRIE